jgi:succinate dehydrogenase / fumarate reductase, membrane anchor subunit
MKTTYSQVEGLGSAKSGSHHWWLERLTSVALIPLTILFVFPFVQAIGENYFRVRDLYAHPYHATVAILFIFVMFYHLRMGLQVVIDDYVHNKAWHLGLTLINIAYCSVLGLVGILSVLRLVLIA